MTEADHRALWAAGVTGLGLSILWLTIVVLCLAATLLFYFGNHDDESMSGGEAALTAIPLLVAAAASTLTAIACVRLLRRRQGAASVFYRTFSGWAVATAALILGLFAYLTTEEQVDAGGWVLASLLVANGLLCGLIVQLSDRAVEP